MITNSALSIDILSANMRPFIAYYFALNHVVSRQKLVEVLCMGLTTQYIIAHKSLPKGRRKKSFETIQEPFESHCVIIATALHYNRVLHIPPLLCNSILFNKIRREWLKNFSMHQIYVNPMLGTNLYQHELFLKISWSLAAVNSLVLLPAC